MTRIVVRLQPTDIAWIILVGYVVGCNLTLREQLSMAVDRYLKSHRWATETTLLGLYLHLSNRVPDKFDPIHLLFLGLVKVLRRRITVIDD